MSNNTTYWEYRDDPVFLVDYHPILITCCVIICITNALVITLFWTQASLRSAANYLLFSLAISDLAVGIFGIPVNLLCEMLAGKTCLLSYIINRFIAVSTTYHIFWITLEKYSAIIFPLWHKSHFDKKKVKYTCLCTWLASVLLSVIELSWLAQNYDPYGHVTDDVKRKAMIYNVFIFTSVFVVPMAVMIFAYISIFLQILGQHSNEFLRRHMHSKERKGLLRVSRNTKSALLFFFILVVFILGWFWWFFMVIYYNILNYEEQFAPYPVLKFLVTLRYITAIVNPILYAFLKRDFNKAVKKFTNRSRLTPVTEQLRTRNSTILYRQNRPASVHFDISSERR